MFITCNEDMEQMTSWEIIGCLETPGELGGENQDILDYPGNKISQEFL